jgi:ribosomal protein S18 acetylase RimI-like enzyme
MARAGDAHALAVLVAEGFAAAHRTALPAQKMQEHVQTIWNEQQMEEKIATSAIQILVAEVEQTIIGLVGLDPNPQPSYLHQSASAELCRFYLHPDWIGNGIGSTLMTHMLDHAMEKGYRLCWLRVWQGNKTAIHFYRRWGFKTITTSSYDANGYALPVWVMIRPLVTNDVLAMQ